MKDDLQPLIDESLMQLSASRADMSLVMDEIEAAVPPDGSPVHPVHRYILQIQHDSIEDSPVKNPKLRHRLEPSIRRLSLDLWPEFDLSYRVGTRPDGASDLRFLPRLGSTAERKIASALDVQPWKVTRSEVENAFGSGARSDGWQYDWQAWYTLPSEPGAEPIEYQLVFELDLLQGVWAEHTD